MFSGRAAWPILSSWSPLLVQKLTFTYDPHLARDRTQISEQSLVSAMVSLGTEVKEAIRDKLSRFRVVVVTGQTGCG